MRHPRDERLLLPGAAGNIETVVADPGAQHRGLASVNVNGTVESAVLGGDRTRLAIKADGNGDGGARWQRQGGEYLRHGIQVELTEQAREYVLHKGFDPRFGARPLRQQLLKLVEAPLADLLASGGIPYGSRILVAATGIDRHGQALDFMYAEAPDLLQQAQELRAAEVGRGGGDGSPQQPSVGLSTDHVGTIEATRFASGRKNALQFEINGSKGSLSFDIERLNELEVHYTNSTPGKLSQGFRTVLVSEADHPFWEHWWPQGHMIGWEHTFVHEIHHFLSAIRDDTEIGPHGATFEDGYRAAEICDAMLRSDKSGARETVSYRS